MERFNYMLEIDILRNSSQNIGCPNRGAFLGFGRPKRHPDALLTKTIKVGQQSRDSLSIVTYFLR